jgi:hypothetical protein
MDETVEQEDEEVVAVPSMFQVFMSKLYSTEGSADDAEESQDEDYESEEDVESSASDDFEEEEEDSDEEDEEVVPRDSWMTSWWQNVRFF